MVTIDVDIINGTVLAMIYILLAIIALQIAVHYFERQELMDRLMSRNLSEFKNEPIKTKYKSAHARTLKGWREKK